MEKKNTFNIQKDQNNANQFQQTNDLSRFGHSVTLCKKK